MGTAMFVKAMMKQFSDPEGSNVELDVVVVAPSWGAGWLCAYISEARHVRVLTHELTVRLCERAINLSKTSMNSNFFISSFVFRFLLLKHVGNSAYHRSLGIEGLGSC